MKQTLTMKGRSLMLTVFFTLSLAALLMFSGAASKAEAQSAPAVPTSPAPGPDPFLDPDQFDQLTGCPWYMYEECAITPGDVSGAATASPSAPATSASPSAPSTASASAPATTASPSTPATRDQYGPVPDTDGKATGPVPDTGGKAAAPAQTGKAKEEPDTGGRVAVPAESTEATGLPEPNRNSSALPLMIGSGALLVGGGLLTRRLIR